MPRNKRTRKRKHYRSRTRKAGKSRKKQSNERAILSVDDKTSKIEYIPPSNMDTIMFEQIDDLNSFLSFFKSL